MVVRDALSEDELDALFKALGDATRRDLLRRTLRAPHSVSTLARDYDLSFAAVQKHVAVLEAAGLVHKTSVGRERLVRADPDQLRRAQAALVALADLWRARVSGLDQLLTELDPSQE